MNQGMKRCSWQMTSKPELGPQRPASSLRAKLPAAHDPAVPLATVLGSRVPKPSEVGWNGNTENR